MKPRLLDLFCGAEGWGLAARELGLSTLGIEWDESAIATSRAAGFHVVQADVAALDPLDFAPCEGLIGSPPCQAWSSAGKGEGRKATTAYLAAIAHMGRGEPVDAVALDEACADERAHLVLEPLRWALALEPRWIALEQVKEALPIWRAMAAVLRERGYSAWCGKVSAERYGVPQTRARAILIASLDCKVRMPTPTHQRYIAPKQRKAREATDEAHGGGLFDAAPERIVHCEDRGLLPWVSMAEALGGMTARPYWTEGPAPAPAPTVTAGGGATGGVEVFASKGARSRAAGAVVFVANANANANANACVRDVDEPAPTITAGHDHGERRWVVQTDNFTGTGYTGGETAKYERPVDEPAPTLSSRADLWKVTHYDRRQGETHSDGSRTIRRRIPVDEPAPAIAPNAAGRDVWITERPAASVNCDPRIAEPGRHEPEESGSQYGPATVRVTVEEAAILQSFPRGYPWHAAGSKTAAFRCVGNAIPPLLAWHVLRAVA